MKTPRRIYWTADEDLQCAILASMGFSTKMICDRTGLSPCQVAYRLHKAKIKRAEYRNGESRMAERVMDMVTPGSRQGIRDVLGLKVIS